MISVFWAIAIIYGIFWMTFLLRNRYEIPHYSKIELMLFFVFAQLVPGLILRQWSLRIWRNAVAELVIFGLLVYYVQKRKDRDLHSCIYAMYLFQPGVILSILLGNLYEMFLTLFLCALLIVLDLFVKKRNGSLMAFWPEYLAGSGGIFLWFISTKVYEQRLKDVFRTENIPSLYIVAVALVASSVAFGIYRILAKEYCSDTVWKRRGTLDKCSCFECVGNDLQVKDLILMGSFTLLFAMVVLFKIGSFRVPETYRILQQGEAGDNEIVLEFRDQIEISQIYIYLGYQGKRKFSFSYMEENSKSWTVFESDHIVESAFCWNRIDVNQSMKLLGIVLREGDASIHEIVCLDQYGRQVFPINAGYYSKLFDEQALFQKNATYYHRTMFDEVYHARTAYEFLNRLSVYENTHPPLGKTIISLGIRAFGMNPFGWRIMCALCGILMVPVIYLFAHRMFGTTGSASFATLLLCTEFMHFTLSRIATLDIIVAFFILLMLFFMYCFCKECSYDNSLYKQMIWILLCGCSTAMAVSVKWTGIYAAFGIAVIFFAFLSKRFGGMNAIRENRKYLGKLFVGCTIFFILIPLFVYTLSYIPFTRVYQDKGLVKTMLDNAKLMLAYHKDCVFEHPYSSEWYEWIFDKKPLLDSYNVLENDSISTVATFGNPLILWCGFAALLHQFYLWRCRGCKNAQFLIIAYASAVMPWLFIHRTLFIYHYFPAIVILILMIANSFCHMKSGNKGRILFLIGSIGLFVLFYPVISGITVKMDYVNQILEWMHTWKFAL